MSQPMLFPSILAADFAVLGEEVQAVLEAGADGIHFDVMDYQYVPNLTIGPPVLKSLRNRFPDVVIDAHLMVAKPERMVEDFVEAGANYLSIHPESTERPEQVLAAIRSAGCGAGVVLNPDTPVETLDRFLDLVSLVLVMSVVPGFGGQSFMPETLPKITAVRERIDRSGAEIQLEVDGGINESTVDAVKARGADMIVAGSAIFGADDYAAAIARLRQEAAA